MKPLIIFFWLGLILTSASCSRDKRIRGLLSSKSATDIEEGALEAGETGDEQYVSLLLHDAGNPSASTSLRFKGFTIYTEKMYALRDILHVSPPHHFGGILETPDSVNIKFYTQYWEKLNKKK